MPLEREDIEAIARRIDDLLRERRVDADLADVSALAARLGVTRSWVYAHSRELHAIRLGKGPRARLRFDVPTTLAALADEDPAVSAQRPARARSRKPAIPAGVELIHGRSARRPLRVVDS